jgi:hypothetical protein
MRCEDPARSRWPDPDDPGYLYAVVAYASRYRRDIPLVTLTREIGDLLLIINFLHEQLDHRMLKALTRAHRDYKIAWIALAEPLGVTTRAGALLTFQRLAEAFREGGSGRRSEVFYRRRHDRLELVPVADVPDTTAAKLVVLTREFLALRRVIPTDLAEELGAVADAEDTTPASMLGALRWLVGELRESPEALSPRLAALVDQAAGLLAAR